MPTVSRSYWVRHDEIGTITDVSPALLERIGLSPDDVLNKSLETIVVSGSAQDFRVAWGERFANDPTGDLIWELNTSPGCSPFSSQRTAMALMRRMWKNSFFIRLTRNVPAP